MPVTGVANKRWTTVMSSENLAMFSDYNSGIPECGNSGHLQIPKFSNIICGIWDVP